MTVEDSELEKMKAEMAENVTEEKEETVSTEKNNPFSIDVNMDDQELFGDKEEVLEPEVKVIPPDNAGKGRGKGRPNPFFTKENASFYAKKGNEKRKELRDQAALIVNTTQHVLSAEVPEDCVLYEKLKAKGIPMPEKLTFAAAAITAVCINAIEKGNYKAIEALARMGGLTADQINAKGTEDNPLVLQHKGSIKEGVIKEIAGILKEKL